MVMNALISCDFTKSHCFLEASLGLSSYLSLALTSLAESGGEQAFFTLDPSPEKWEQYFNLEV
jgi:hypothetical protein